MPYFSTNSGVRNTPGPTKMRGWKNAGGSRRYVGENSSERRDIVLFYFLICKHVLMLATRHTSTGYTTPTKGESFCATARTGWIQSFVPAKFSNVFHRSHRPSIWSSTVSSILHSCIDTVNVWMAWKHKAFVWGIRLHPVPKITGCNRLMSVGQQFAFEFRIVRGKVLHCIQPFVQTESVFIRGYSK